MTQALHHDTYSAILNTEATSTFMFLPVWDNTWLGCTHGWLTINLSPFVLMRGGAWQRQRASRCYNLKCLQQVAATLTTRARAKAKS
eukprot:1161774-Pelagomonas_calceolata.AAC.1